MLGLAVSVWVTRYLGPHDFGLLSYSLAFIAFFSWLSDLGLRQITVRELTKYPEKKDQILCTVFVLKLIGAILSVLLIATSISYLKPDDDLLRLVIWLASLSYILQTFSVIDLFFQSRVLSKYTAMASACSIVATSALKIYFIVAKYSVVYFAMATLFDLLVTGILLTVFFISTGSSIRAWRFNPSLAAELLKYAWPLMISTFLISIHMRVDQVMIERMLSIEQLGVYSVAVRLSEFWFFIPGIAVSTMMPYFVSLREIDYDLYARRFQQILSFMFWMGAVVGVFTVLVGRSLLSFLYGEAFEGAYWALVFNIWSGIFVAQGLASSLWLITENLQIYRLYVQIAAVAINLAANGMLIPVIGISGAAISTLLTHFISAWVLGFVFVKTRSMTSMMIAGVSPMYMISFIRDRVRTGYTGEK